VDRTEITVRVRRSRSPPPPAVATTPAAPPTTRCARGAARGAVAAPAPGLVDVPQASEQLAHDEDRDGMRQGAGPDERIEIDAVDILHDEVGPPLEVSVEVEDRDHVRMRQLGGLMCLSR